MAAAAGALVWMGFLLGLQVRYSQGEMPSQTGSLMPVSKHARLSNAEFSAAGPRERAVLAWLCDHEVAIGFAVVTLLGLAARLAMLGLETEDYTMFLLPWYQKIRDAGGFLGLAHPIEGCDYTVFYQEFIALAASLGIPPLLAYKGLSCTFDFVLAVACSNLVRILLDKDADARADANRRWILPLVAYGLVLLLPTVVLNSAGWAQCDAIWTSLVVLSLCDYFRGRYGRCFAFVGLSFAVKLQTVFILPFYLFVYLKDRRFSVRNALTVLVFYLLPSLPAVLVGRSITTVVLPYLQQTAEYPYMSLYYPNLWYAVGLNEGPDLASQSMLGYSVLKWAAIGLMLGALALAMVWLLPRERRLDLRGRVMVLCLFLYLEVALLPAMHERYGYLLDLALLVLALIDRRFWWLFALTATASLACYDHFIFGSPAPGPALAWAFMAGCVYLLVQVVRSADAAGE